MEEKQITPRKERTPQQAANHVRYAVEMINAAIDAAPIMKHHSFFNFEQFKETGLDELIKRVCAKYDVDENHIRNIGKFTYQLDLIK